MGLVLNSAPCGAFLFNPVYVYVCAERGLWLQSKLKKRKKNLCKKIVEHFYFIDSTLEHRI